MTDAVVAIETALMARATQFASINALQISLPNIAYAPPPSNKTAKWLKAVFLPKAVPPDFGISPGNYIYTGILEIDVYYGQGAGSLNAARIASDLIAYFQRGTSMTYDGTTVTVLKAPYRSVSTKDGPWLKIAISIPYQSFVSVVAVTPPVSSPDVGSPDVSSPDVSSPDVSSPDVSSPDISSPDVSSPDVSSPDVSSPDVSSPDVTFPLSQRSVINMNFTDFAYEYLFINHLLCAETWLPNDAGFNGLNPPWQQILDPLTGYPNTAGADGKAMRAGINIPAYTDFSGPWVLAWEGEARMTANDFGWTEINAAQASGTVTGSSASIAAAQNYVTGQKVTSTALGNIAGSTTYYVCSGTTGSALKLATTYANAVAGTALVPNTGGSITVTPKGYGSYTKNSNGNWTKTPSSGTECYIVFIDPGNSTTPSINNAVRAYPASTSGSDGYFRNARFYRLEDEEDYLAGNVYRTPWKQQYVSYNPSAIRFMNWIGGNKDMNVRWENRVLPSQSSCNQSWTVGPYGYTAAAVANQMTLTAIADTPVAMQHGEAVNCTIGVPFVRADDGRRSVSVNPTGGGSTTARATLNSHGWQVGDWVLHCNFGGGLPHLENYPRQITAVTTNTYDFANAAGAGLGSTSTGLAQAYATLNVGNRGTYPILFSGGAYASTFGFLASNFLTLYYNKAFFFDKTYIGCYDGSGNPVHGAWLMVDSNSSLASAGGGVPPELCTAMVNELNAMSVAQGITTPIHMWVNCPSRGMVSIDPDYSSGSNWPVNFINTVINGSTVNSKTWAGLTSAAGIFLEFSNEVWNTGPADCPGFVLDNYALGRWYPNGANNWKDAVALRATCMTRDVKQAFPSEAANGRIRTLIGMQLVDGFTAGSFNSNYDICFGRLTNDGVGYLYMTDSAVVSGNWGRPIDNIDGVCPAAYQDPFDSYYSNAGAGGFADDVDLYNGTGAHTGAANPTLAVTHYVNAVVAQSYAGYFDQYSAGLPAGKYCLQYEGGPDWPVEGGTYGLTVPQGALLTAVQNSTQWRDAQISIWAEYVSRSNCFMPAQYLSINGNNRWAYAAPDSYASHIEGQGLLNNPTWVGESSRNRALTT